MLPQLTGINTAAWLVVSGTIDFNDFLTIMTEKMCEKDSKEEILKAFRLFDDDETGKISFKNLKRVAKELGENLTDEELQVSLEAICIHTLADKFLCLVFSWQLYLSSNNHWNSILQGSICFSPLG